MALLSKRSIGMSVGGISIARGRAIGGVKIVVHPWGQKLVRHEVLMESIEKTNQLVSICFSHRLGRRQDNSNIAIGYWDGDGGQSGVNYQGGLHWM
jgi:hypothetical protein